MTPDQSGAGNDPGAIVVRRYALRPPTGWDEDCEAEMRRMTDLWNRLVEIERAHRQAFQDATAHDPDVARLQSAITVIDTQIARAIDALKAKRKASRTRARDDGTVTDLKAQRKPLYAELKAAQKSAREAAKPKLQGLEQVRRAQVKTAYQQSGLWWGNYNAVVASYEHARQAVLKRGGELHFRHHAPDCRIVNQIQGGMSVDDLLTGKHSQARLVVSPTVKDTKFFRRGGRYATLTATVFTYPKSNGKGRERREVAWPLVLDQSFPDDARTRIKEIVIRREMRADRAHWSASFLCRAPAQLPAERGRHECGIDVGWRRLRNRATNVGAGLRVATVVSTALATPAYVVLPETTLDDARHVDDLAARRDAALAAIVSTIRLAQIADAPAMLQAVADRIKSAPKVRAGLVAKLAREWRQYPDYRPELRRQVAAWQRRDRQDWQEHTNLAKRISRRRADIYHHDAVRIVRDHRRIGIENLDVAGMARRQTPTGDINSIAVDTGWFRRLAAPAEFLQILKQTAVREGMVLGQHIVEISGRSTWICAHCRTEVIPANRSELRQICTHCGRGWDQDENAGRNLLAAVKRAADATPE